jgi:hypothetical protein
MTAGTEQPRNPMMHVSPTGNQSAIGCFAFTDSPRSVQRGFSFGAYYFYFWFSHGSPSCARGQMMPV